MTAATVTGPAAPAVKPRVSMAEGLTQTLTLAWRTIVQVRHNPWELGDYSIQPIMFVLLFTYVFGGAIAGSTGDYLTFALPGIIVMNMLFVTMYVGTGLNTDLTKGVFDRLRSLPIARWAPMAGRILADQVKQAWSIFLQPSTFSVRKSKSSPSTGTSSVGSNLSGVTPRNRYKPGDSCAR